MKDQKDNIVSIDSPAKRIISVVPSQTELLSDLGLENEVIAITKFCIHPEKWFRSKERIGGTKNLNVEKIKKLNPDLIIANKEENEKDQIEELRKEFPVYVSDINSFESALAMMEDIGKLTDRVSETKKITDELRRLYNENKIQPDLSCLYLIWKNPYMAAGSDTFISSMLKIAGYRNAASKLNRYPEVTITGMQTLQPDLIFLSSEPFPFKEKDVDELKQYFPETEIMTVDGELFSWYGSRMLKAFSYFQKLRSHIKRTS